MQQVIAPSVVGLSLSEISTTEGSQKGLSKDWPSEERTSLIENTMDSIRVDSSCTGAYQSFSKACESLPILKSSVSLQDVTGN